MNNVPTIVLQLLLNEGNVPSGLCWRNLTLFSELLLFNGIMQKAKQKGKRTISACCLYSAASPPQCANRCLSLVLLFNIYLLFLQYFCSQGCWLLGANKMWMWPRHALSQSSAVTGFIFFFNFFNNIKRNKKSTSLFLHLVAHMWEYSFFLLRKNVAI